MNSSDVFQTLSEFACLGLTGFAAVLWFIVRAVRQDARDALAQLAAYKTHVAETYVTEAGMTKAIANLDTTIQRLIDAVNSSSKETRDAFVELSRRIDGKADK